MKSDIELVEYFQKPNKVELLCRLCLTELAENSVSLFDFQDSMVIAEKIMMCTNICIKNEDPLPRQICELCLKELIVADGFRLKCLESDTRLRNVFTKYSAYLQVTSFKEDIHCKDSDEMKCVKKEDNLGHETNESQLEIPFKKIKKSKLTHETPTKLLADDILEQQIDIKVEDQDLDEVDNNYSDFESDVERNSSVKRKPIPSKEKTKIFCSLCNKSLISETALERHLRKCHNSEKKGLDKKFHCPDCDYKTHRRQAIVYHIHTHTGAKPFKCDMCDRSFSQPSTLKVHMKIHSDKMYFTCAECGKQFKYRKVYRTHMLVHSTERNFVCTICSRALKTTSALKVHMRRHNNIKNYACEACGATFVTGEELRSHVRIHTNKAKKYHCNICKFSTNEKQKLEIHLKRHAGDRSVSCELCDFACYAPHELRLHMRKHTKEQKYGCPECELKFKHSSSVNKHMLKAHGKKYKWGKCVDRRTVK